MKRGIRIIAVFLCLVLWSTLPAGAVFAESEEETGAAAEVMETDRREETDPAGDHTDYDQIPEAAETDEFPETAAEDAFTEFMETENEAAFKSDELEIEEEVVVDPSAVGDNDELLSDYLDVTLGVSSEASLSVAGAEKWLTGANRTIYLYLKEKIKKVAEGEAANTSFEMKPSQLGMQKTSWTAKDLGLSSLGTWNAAGKFTPSREASRKLSEAISAEFSLERIITALLFDSPYDLYWYEKTAGTKLNINYSIKSKPEDTISLSQVTFHLIVAEEYADPNGAKYSDTSAGKEYPLSVDLEKTKAVNQVADTVGQIITEQEGKSDYAKLLGYKNAVCDLTDYNRTAADSANNVPYGNPWQLVWVFDGDPDTKVVCEGYSKAFQYLCDLSTFQNSRIDSRIVTGKMNTQTRSENHMWNLVTMEDGANYLVDVTNCDTGKSGYPERLFLTGGTPVTEDDPKSGYSVVLERQTIGYVYDKDTCSSYDPAELRLNRSSYVYDPEMDCSKGGPHALQYVSRLEPGCESAGHIAYWVCKTCQKLFADAGAKEQIGEDSLVIPATGHRFGKPEWIWTSDLSGATAVFTCSNNKDHIHTVEAAVTEKDLDPELAAYVFYAEIRFAGRTYSASKTKSLPEGWIQTGDSGNWYYVDSEGSFVSGWLNDNNTWYYLDPESHVMKTGWQFIGGEWYYLSGYGAMLTGWQKISGVWYYLKDSGAMAAGWIKDGSSWYYLKASGAMAAGWIKDGRSWYYLKASGAMATGWIKDGSTWYYLKSSGAMASEEWCGGYWLSRSGAWTYMPKGSWKKDSVGWWFGDTSGWYAKRTGQIIDGVYYQFDTEGYWIER